MSVDVTLWSSDSWSSAADLELLGEARAGSAEAYGELWRRHLPAAYAVASRYRGRSSAEDIVAEASARVLSLIQGGKGPEEHFRSYFLSAVRTVAVDNARRDLRVVPAESDDLEALTEPVLEDFPGDGIDADLVREAFAGLSERDQRVLWHTTVEGEAPRTLAPVLGMTANAVSASAVRAREALRAHYLDAHASRRARSADSDECRWTMNHLGAHVRGRLPKRQAQRVREHLDRCPHAATVAAELTEINAGFPALLVPLILLAGVSTPGFVSAGALAGLSAGAVSGGSGAPGGPGGGIGSSAIRPEGSSAAASSAGQVVVVGQQVAAVASSVAAAIVIGAGVVGASPGAARAPDTVASDVVVTPTQGSGGGGGATKGGRATGSVPGTPRAASGSPSPGPSRSVGNGAGAATPSGSGAVGGSGPTSVGTGTTTGSAGGAPTAGARTPGSTGTAAPSSPAGGSGPGTPPGGGTSASSSSPAPPSRPSSLPAPPSQPGTPSSPSSRPSSSPSTPPSSPTPPPAQQLSVLGVVRADGEAWVQIPAAPAGLRVTLTNRFGVGTLTPENRAWQCAGSGTATLSCTVKSGGRFKLVQRGVPGAAPIVVSSNAILGLTVVLPVGR